MRYHISSILILVLFIASCDKDLKTPVARFAVSPLKGDVEEGFFFDAGISYDHNDPLSKLKFRWDWEGDGLWDTPYSSEMTINHKFYKPGKYNVHLEVINTKGLISITFREVEVLITGPLYPPEIIFPPNEGNNLELSSLLKWNCYHIENSDLTYDFYFGENQDPPLLCKNYYSNIYDPGLLKSGTIYYWKIIARDNSGNTSISPIWSFSTHLFDNRDKQIYQVIIIGDNIWMAENLNYKTDMGSWCFGDDSLNCDLFGRLYDWETAHKSCPLGWHLPPDGEWQSLELAFFLFEIDQWGPRGGNQGDILRKGGSSGFNVLMAGIRDYYGLYSIPGTDSGFWT